MIESFEIVDAESFDPIKTILDAFCASAGSCNIPVWQVERLSTALEFVLGAALLDAAELEVAMRDERNRRLYQAALLLLAKV